jgi:hypothetical protein
MFLPKHPTLAAKKELVDKFINLTAITDSDMKDSVGLIVKTAKS